MKKEPQGEYNKCSISISKDISKDIFERQYFLFYGVAWSYAGLLGSKPHLTFSQVV